MPVAPARMVPLHMAPAVTAPCVPLAAPPCPTPDASPAAVQEAAKALDELNKEVQALRQQVKDMKNRAGERN